MKTKLHQKVKAGETSLRGLQIELSHMEKVWCIFGLVRICPES